MNETVGTTWLFKYILGFTLIFSGFLALTISYNRVYKIKNESLTIIEKYEGVTYGNSQTLEIINNYLKNSGYNTKGDCDVNTEYGVASLENPTYERAQSNQKYFYCLKSRKVNGNNTDKIYYEVKFFFKFNLPIVGELFTFKITGETKGVNYYSDLQEINEE